MSFIDHIPGVVSAIIPDVDSDPKHQYRWRLSIAMTLLGLMAFAALQTVHILIACGWMASFGLSGFAYASDLNNIRNAQVRYEVRQIEKYLMDMEATNCRSREAGKPTRYINEQIRHAMHDYYELTGQNWLRPSCEELGE